MAFNTFSSLKLNAIMSDIESTIEGTLQVQP
jgi:hypothetical protein